MAELFRHSLDDAAHLPDGAAVRIEVEPLKPDFATCKGVDELAREQGVNQIRSVAELAGDWPTEDSIDEFLAFIREARK